MTAFAIPIWLFQKTERVQELALLGLAFLVPAILMSPIAGLLVDRHSRKVMMLLSDLAAGLTTVVLLLLVATDSLNIWREAAYGFRYILDRPSLLGLQSVFISCNFLNSLAFTTTAAMMIHGYFASTHYKLC